MLPAHPRSDRPPVFLSRFASLAIGVIVLAVAAPKALPGLFDLVAGKPTAAVSVPVGDDVAPGYNNLIALRADPQGHFQVDAVINGHSVAMMVDTGATFVALDQDTARRLGITPDRSDYTMPISTANGTIGAAPVTIAEIRIGTVVVRNVQASVVPSNTLGVNLLGMSFLKRLSKFEIGGGQLVLVQ